MRRAKFIAIVSSAAFIAAMSAGIQAKADSIPTQGLIGDWTGNNTAADSSSVHNNGSFSGSYVPGGPRGDAAFNLATGKVSIPNNGVYDNFQNDPGWTVGFWFNANGTSVNQGVAFLGQDNGSGYQPKWFIDYGYTVFGPNSDFIWHVNDYNTERIFLASNPLSVPSGWNQLTVVTDNVGRSVTFYLDGKSIGSAGLPSYVLETSAPLIFGQAEGGLPFNGLMNNVTIYDRALSSKEVSALANVTPLPKSASMGLALLIAVGGFGWYRSRSPVRNG